MTTRDAEIEQALQDGADGASYLEHMHTAANEDDRATQLRLAKGIRALIQLFLHQEGAI